MIAWVSQFTAGLFTLIYFSNLVVLKLLSISKTAFKLQVQYSLLVKYLRCFIKTVSSHGNLRDD